MPDQDKTAHRHPPHLHAAWLQASATQTVFAALTAQGHEARAVGGCVRNALFKALELPGLIIPPVTDIDIATTSTPDQTERLAQAAGLRTVPTGLAHGTITVLADEQSFEVTTLRQDVATDGRHAEVSFTTDWTKDAARRDLTINALYADADGQIFDPLGGFNDLAVRRIRFVGDPVARIREDYLRTLRFFRFFAQYGAGIPDAAGLQAAISERKGLSQLSAERIRQELLKLVVAPAASQTLTLMRDFGVLAEILPAAPNLKRFERLVELDSTRQTEQSASALRLASLSVHTLEDAERLAKKLRLSRNETATLSLAALILDERRHVPPAPAIACRWLYSLGPDRYRSAIQFARSLTDTDTSDAQWEAAATLPDIWTAPVFPVNGTDLMAQGAAPGRELGVTLKQLEEAWIASDFALTRQELLSTLKKRS